MEVAMKKRYSIVKEQNPQRETTAKRFSSTIKIVNGVERSEIPVTIVLN
jgi:hypothetical protein